MHELTDLAALASQRLEPRLAAVQQFAVEARYEEGPFPLPAARTELLPLLEAELEHCERAGLLRTSEGLEAKAAPPAGDVVADLVGCFVGWPADL